MAAPSPTLAQRTEPAGSGAAIVQMRVYLVETSPGVLEFTTDPREATHVWEDDGTGTLVATPIAEATAPARMATSDSVSIIIY